MKYIISALVLAASFSMTMPASASHIVCWGSDCVDLDDPGVHP